MSIEKPIRSASQIPESSRGRIRCNHPDNEWIQGLQENDVWWYSGNTPKPANDKEADAMEKAFVLRDKLLTFGGHLACMPLFDRDIDKILDNGEFLFGDHAQHIKGERNRCHQNSARYWAANRNKGEYHIATGYALSDDGCWRQHTWVVAPKNGEWQVLESTTDRVAYFGAVLSQSESMAFADAELGSMLLEDAVRHIL